MEKLKIALNELQSNTIGIAEIYGNIELVVESNDYIFTAISIGKLGGLSISHYPKSDFSFKYFPNKQSLSDFLKTPLTFNNWFAENFKN